MSEYLERIVDAILKRAKGKVTPAWAASLATVPPRELDAVLAWWNCSHHLSRHFMYTMVRTVVVVVTL